MSTAIYNEIDPFAAGWLRALIGQGHIAPGVVDERSIVELHPPDVLGDAQRHFFAGIGGWSHALRLAGWPDDAPVWTGSCPCQPFSTAGRKRGTADERHLWPAWFALIAQCRPAIVFGEQVASPDGLGWLDAVRADLEGAGYAFGVSDLCAAGVGAPHIRQRLYFVAITDRERLEGIGVQLRERGSQPTLSEADRVGSVGALADGTLVGWREGQRCEARGGAGFGDRERLGDTSRSRSGRDAGAILGAQREGERERVLFGRIVDVPVAASATRGFWTPAEWVLCRDGKARPIEPGAFPLAHGVSARVGRLRGYGNAIVPPLAALFIQAVMEALWG